MADSIMSSDLSSICAGSVVTHCLRVAFRLLLQRNVPGWSKLEHCIQERISVEIATIPVRILLGICIFPIVSTAFTPLEHWRKAETELCLFAW